MFGSNQQNPSMFNATTSGFTFGTPTAVVTPGLGLGGSNPSTVGSAGTLFSSTSFANTTTVTPALPTNTFTGFGAATAATTRTGFLFGQTAPAATTMAGGGFGSTVGTSASAAPGYGSLGGFSVASQPSSTGALGGVGTAPAGSLSLGSFAPSAFTGAPVLNMAGTTSLPSLGLGQQQQFGPSALGASAVQPSGGLGSFGQLSAITTTTTTTVPSLGLGLFGSTTAPTFQLQQGLGIAPTQSVATVGLGGTSITQTSAGDTKSDSKTLKEYPVPSEIMALTEEFKKFLKDQKATREEIAKVSSKPLVKVQDETSTQQQLLSVVSSGIAQNISNFTTLKQETAIELRNTEMMQRTKDIPLALQYENTAPMDYFQQLIMAFMSKMRTYRQQINLMEQHLAFSTDLTFTPYDLIATMRKIHDAFVYLAAELQTIHENCEHQKNLYATYRRLVHGDSADVFAACKMASKHLQSTRVPVTVGPSPFSGVQTATIAALASALEKAQQQSGVSPALGLSTGTLGTSLNASGTGIRSSAGFGSSAFAPSAPSYSAPPTPVFGVSNQPFQLQKPPVGNKRGKR